MRFDPLQPEQNADPLPRRAFLRYGSSLLLGLCAAALELPAAARLAPGRSGPAPGSTPPAGSPASAVSPSGATGSPPPRPPGGPMLTRAIPSTGQKLPVIGMGTWQTFDPPSTDPASLAPLEEVLKIFFEAGGRVVDSSPMYGRAEEVTGLLSTRLGLNRDLFLATKVWTSGEEAGIRQMEQSLARLKREQLELMQIHNLVDWRVHLKTLRKWKEQGRFRYIGITHYQLSAFAELEAILRRERLDFIQLPYSIDVREAEKRLLPAAQELGVAVLVMRPFESGGLFGKVRNEPLPEFVKAFAGSWAQAFLKFILAHPAVTSVIPATSKPHHMRDNVQAGFGPLPDAQARERLVTAVRG